MRNPYTLGIILRKACAGTVHISTGSGTPNTHCIYNVLLYSAVYAVYKIYSAVYTNYMGEEEEAAVS